MRHQLQPDDLAFLDDVLAEHLRKLLDEIAHTDDRDFRTALRERYERIEQIRSRLDDLGASLPTPPLAPLAGPPGAGSA